MGKSKFDPSPEETASLPSEGIRTIVSFLLIVHLSALFAGWVGSSTMGRSQLVGGAADKFFQPYLRMLWLGTSYEYNHMNGPQSQIGAVVRAQYTNPKETNPPAAYPVAEKLNDRWDRRQMYLQRLINDAIIPNGEFLMEEETNRRLEFVGAQILRETGASDVKIRGYLPAADLLFAREIFAVEPAKRSPYNPKIEEPGNYESVVTIQMQTNPGELPTFTRLAGKMQSAPAAPKTSPSPKPSAAPAGNDNPPGASVPSTKSDAPRSDAPSP